MDLAVQLGSIDKTIGEETIQDSEDYKTHPY